MESQPFKGAENPTIFLGTPGFFDSVLQPFPIDETLSLELSFHHNHLSSMTALVSGTKSLLSLSQARPLTPVECGDEPINSFGPLQVLGMPMSPGCSDLCFLSSVGTYLAYSLIPLGKPLRKPPPHLKASKIYLLLQSNLASILLRQSTKRPPNGTLEPNTIGDIYKYFE